MRIYKDKKTDKAVIDFEGECVLVDKEFEGCMSDLIDTRRVARVENGSFDFEGIDEKKSKKKKNCIVCMKSFR